LHLQDVPDREPKSLREVTRLQSVTGGQGRLKYDCKEGYKTSRCKFEQAKVLCNSRCHHSAIYDNNSFDYYFKSMRYIHLTRTSMIYLVEVTTSLLVEFVEVTTLTNIITSIQHIYVGFSLFSLLPDCVNFPSHHRMDVPLHVITLYITGLLLEEGRETEINTSGIEVSQTLRILFELDVVIKYISMFPFILNHVLVKI